VDYDLRVGSVGHIAEKVHASAEALGAWSKAGKSILMLLPEADYAAVAGTNALEGVTVVPVGSAREALNAIDLAAPPAGLPAIAARRRVTLAPKSNLAKWRRRKRPLRRRRTAPAAYRGCAVLGSSSITARDRSSSP